MSVRGSAACLNGTCSAEGTCICDQNFYGPACDVHCVDVTANDTGTCGGYGYCGADGTCVCSAGRFGLDCSMEDTTISDGCPSCVGNSYCVRNIYAEYECSCLPSWFPEGSCDVQCSPKRLHQFEVRHFPLPRPMSPRTKTIERSSCHGFIAVNSSNFVENGTRFPICVSSLQLES